MLITEYLGSSLIAFTITALILGLMVGSFLNVVIFRLPVMLKHDWKNQCEDFLEIEATSASTDKFNLSMPSSHCPQCQHKIRWWENIPLISYLLLRGRCSNCQAHISLRYPIIELFTGCITAFVAWHFGYGLPALAAMFLAWVLITLSMIDFDTKLLPDSIVLPTLWAGILLNINGTFTSLESSVIGAAAGYMSLWSIYQVHHLLTGREGMGFGDFKLLALLGAWLGWQSLLMILLLSSLVGAAVGISLILFLGRDRQIPIPFGPYLAAAGWISLIWGDQLIQIYLDVSGLQI